MESQLHQRGRWQYTLTKRVVWVLLATEAALVACVLSHTAANLVVLLLAANSVLLIWGAARLRNKPSCCK
jgi:hypothetical protein